MMLNDVLYGPRGPVVQRKAIETVFTLCGLLLQTEISPRLFLKISEITARPARKLCLFSFSALNSGE